MTGGAEEEARGDGRELLEIYKLHVEMADRVSQRREGANRLFVTLLSAMIVLMAAVLRFGTGMEAVAIEFVVVVLTATVLSLAVSWFIVIRSYRQLNTGKFDVLQQLEGKLPFAFYRMEWERLEEGKDPGRYWKLTVVETFLPVIFAALSLAVCIFVFLGFQPAAPGSPPSRPPPSRGRREGGGRCRVSRRRRLAGRGAWPPDRRRRTRRHRT